MKKSCNSIAVKQSPCLSAPCDCSTYGAWERVSDPLRLELHMSEPPVTWSLTWTLSLQGQQIFLAARPYLMPYKRIVSALSLWALSPVWAPLSITFFVFCLSLGRSPYLLSYLSWDWVCLCSPDLSTSVMLLPLTPECWDDRHVWQCLPWFIFFNLLGFESWHNSFSSQEVIFLSRAW